LNQEDGGCGEKWLNSGYILKLELTEFADELDMEYKEMNKE
jgi:hypothetical protein